MFLPVVPVALGMATGCTEATAPPVATKTIEYRVVLSKGDLVSLDTKFAPVPVYYVVAKDGTKTEVSPDVWASLPVGK